MNAMNVKRYGLPLFLLMAALLLSACVGTRMGTSWAAVGLIDWQGEESIVIAYTDQVAILNPTNGVPARLINPVTGEVRRDQDNNPRSWALLGSQYENAQFYTRPIWVDEETFLIADHNGRLLEVDAVTANVERSLPLADQVVADPLRVDDVLYVPFQNGGVTAMSITDYQELWTYPTEGGVWAQPLPVDDMIVFPALDHSLYAVDRESGEHRWSIDLGGSVASAPLLANGRLYVGSFNKSFFEISLDGQILNRYAAQNWVWGTPAIDDEGIVYVADLSGYVHALDTNDGLAERWSVQAAERGIRPGPLVYGQRVIVASRDGKVYWLDRRDGSLINAREIEGRPELLGDLLLLEPSETLNIDQPLILVSSADAGRLLIAFEVDGRQTWVHSR